ncbi:MAG: FxsA family protein [Bacillota bacterium]|uniref:FxsA family protein n=1 Tax=Desulforamulus profundi TaxID=1383067 RepID=UPI000BFF9AAD|nr:FxsA family protein [Desulforamulus profundi]
MLRRFLILLLAVPIIEMLILVETGRRFGFWTTLGILIVLGLLGIFLVRTQGFAVVGKIKQEISLGQVPTTSLLDGLLVLASGLLLLTPGLLTDFVGLAILFEPVRRVLRLKLKSFILRSFLPGRLLRIKW